MKWVKILLNFYISQTSSLMLMDWMKSEFNLKKTYETNRELIEIDQADGNVSTT